MKLPFTWAELTPADKAWLEHIPTPTIWNFVDTLPPDERAPFDAPLYAPSGADFMREYGDRLREYVRTHPEIEIDRDWIEELNALAGATDTEAAKAHAEKLDRLQRRFLADGNIEAYFKAVEIEHAAYWAAHRGELEPFQQALLERREEREATPTFDPLVITAKRSARKQATSSQGGTDRALTEARHRIAELEARVAELTKERDAARSAYIALLDPTGKGGAK